MSAVMAAVPDGIPVGMNPVMVRRIAMTARWKMNRFGFLTEACFTKDEVGDQDFRVKKIPPLPHVRQIVHEWEAYRLLAIPKSRRMIVTWTLICLDLHLAMFEPYTRIYIISSDQGKSDSLVGRCKFVYDNLPDDCLIPKMTVHMGKSSEPTRLDFEEVGSVIMGLPQDPDKIRQEGATLLHVEEMAFWQWPEPAYKAMLPAIQGSGRMAIASSAQANSLFGRICHDDLGEAVFKSAV